MRKYRLVAKKGEGTFSEVLKAQNVKNGKYHAIKCMKNTFDSIDQVNNLREIQALRRLSPHENAITLEEVLYDQPTGRLALVFELMDVNLYELIKGRKHYLNPQLVKSYMWQLMKALDHMHRKGIFHRDIKPENILITISSDIGRGLKLADFGSCRGIFSKQPYTEYISTRWYRAPECLLTNGYYGPEMDLWGAGCVMYEIITLHPLFPGKNEADQIARIHKILGTPAPDVLRKLKSKGANHIQFDFPEQKGLGITQYLTHATPEGSELVVKALQYDKSDRISANEAMKHPYFKDMRELQLKRESEKLNQSNTSNIDASQASSSINRSSIQSNTNINNANTYGNKTIANTHIPSIQNSSVINQHYDNKTVNNNKKYQNGNLQQINHQSTYGVNNSVSRLLPPILGNNPQQTQQPYKYTTSNTLNISNNMNVNSTTNNVQNKKKKKLRTSSQLHYLSTDHMMKVYESLRNNH